MSARRRVAVTGATGLVGSYVARLLAADPSLEVRASRRASSPMDLLGAAGAAIDWHTGDLTDLDFQAGLLEGADAVVHAAGLVSYAPGDSAALREQNVVVTRDLVNLALERGTLAHFVHVSSVAAISPAAHAGVIEESQRSFFPTASTTRYARAKYDAELEVWRGVEEGLGATVLNPSVVLGAGYWHRSSCRLFAWVDAGRRFYPAGATGYVDVRDVAAFAKTCLAAGPTNERYVLNAENWTYRRFFDAVAAALGVAPPSVAVSAWQAEAAWRAEAAKATLTRSAPLLTKESARRAMTRSAYDNARSLAAGARYRPVAETIADVAAAYRDTRARGFGVLPV